MVKVVDAGDFSSLAEAVDYVATNGGGSITVASDQLITANLTVPASVALRIEHTARLQADTAAVTLAVNGSFGATPSQVFEGFGTKKISFARRAMVFPEWWGTGLGHDQIAMNEAIYASDFIALTGAYTVSNTILIPYAGYQGSKKVLMGLHRKAQIEAGAPGIIALQLADSYCQIRNLSLWGRQDGETLLALIPEGGASNPVVANQNHNIIDNIDFNAATESLVLMAGRALGGTASGCWYNRFTNLYFTSVKRCIWLKDNGSADPLTSGSNSNEFSGDMNGSINTGVQIDAGGGNVLRINQENIAYGTAPNAVPTGIIVRNAMANGRINPNNLFHDWHGENVTRHAEIDAPSTKFFNSDLDHTLVTGAAREVFLDDGKTRYKEVTLTCDSGGSITLNPAYNKLSFQEKDGLMRVSGYLHVASITGAPAGVLHVTGLAKSCLAGCYSRTGGTAAVNELNTGSGAAASVCRIIEGTSTIDIFGANDGALKYLAPYLRAGTNITIGVEYPVR